MVFKINKLKLVILSFSVLFFMLGSSLVVKASIGSVIALKPEYPSTQIKEVGSFFIKTTPRQNQILTLDVANLSDDAQKVTVKPTTAYTSRDGSIGYEPGKISVDKSLKYRFSDLVKEKSQTVNVPPHQIIKVNFTIEPPKENYRGIILGAFYTSTDRNSVKSSAENVSFDNKVALVMPVMLKSKDEKLKPHLAISGVNPNKDGTQTLINSLITNNQPTTISDMTFSTKIYRKDNPGEILSRDKRYQLSIAPNSNFTLVNSLGDRTLIPGTYQMEINASDGNGNHWKLHKDFQITAKQSFQYAGKDNWWFIIPLTILMGLILLLFFSFIVNEDEILCLIINSRMDN